MTPDRAYLDGIFDWYHRLPRDACTLHDAEHEAWLAGWDACEADYRARNPEEHLAELLQDAEDEKREMQKRGQSKKYVRNPL